MDTMSSGGTGHVSAPYQRRGHKNWRLAFTVLNASLQFQNAMQKEEERKRLMTKLRKCTVVIWAAELFQAAAAEVTGTSTKLPSTATRNDDFGTNQEGVPLMSRELDVSTPHQYGEDKGVADKIKWDLEKGLHGDEIATKIQEDAFGSNAYSRKKGCRTVWKFLWDACMNKALLTLMVAAIASLALGVMKGGIGEGWSDGGCIMLAVIIVTVVRGSAYRLLLQLQTLNEEQRSIHSEFFRGLLMASISGDNGEETLLQEQLNGVATFIGMVGLVVGIVVLIAQVARYFTEHTKNPDGSIQFIAGWTNIVDAIDGVIVIFTVSVANIYVAAPEEIALVVTFMLAHAMRKMIADKALVRRLKACETMGSATTICFDINQMAVVEAYVCGKKIETPDNLSLLPERVVSLLTESIAENTTGSFLMPESDRVADVFESQTEKAILQWGVNVGINFPAVRSNTSILHSFPFSSEKQRGRVAVKVVVHAGSEVRIHWKGTAEVVLASCTSCIDEDDNEVPMDDDKLSLFKKEIEDMSTGSLECIALAYRSFESEKFPSSAETLDKWQLLEGNFVWLAVVGVKDPCRPGMRDAVQLCTKAGIKVRMFTSDDLQTAKAIGQKCVILQSDSCEPNLTEGNEFSGLSESERQQVAEKICVMGRSSPHDKRLLVQALQRRGDIVAVIGDGTSDISFLSEADVGLVMGTAVPEAANKSPDIIILDDNFASMVKIVRWGRSVYSNSQKVIQFLLTAYLADLILNVVSASSSVDVSLNAVQLLWVSLIMDVLGALALATDSPTDRLMHRPPVDKREPLITNAMWRNSILQALYQVTVLLVLNVGFESIFGDDEIEHINKVKSSFTFNAFVLFQIFNEVNARRPHRINVFNGLRKNSLFIAIVGFTLLLQVNIIMFCGKFTSTVRLNWKLWFISIAFAFISWPLAIIGKMIPVPKTPFAELFTRRFRRDDRNLRGCSIGKFW